LTELAMATLNTGLEPIRGPSEAGAADAAGRPAQVPMSQQAAFGNHGYDMHPQELVRLSGCQERARRRDKNRALLLS
jgi:hypothetical protein